MNPSQPIDPAWFDQIVELVMIRLTQLAQASTEANVNKSIANPADLNENATRHSNEKVINEALILKHPHNSTLIINAKSLVTPSARDAARDRKIQIIRSGEKSS